jgi:hypothetical protein
LNFAVKSKGVICSFLPFRILLQTVTLLDIILQLAVPFIVLHELSITVLEMITDIQGGAEKRENLKLTMRFRLAVKFLLHTQYARGFVTLKRLVRLWKKSLVGVYCLYISQKTLMLW